MSAALEVDVTSLVRAWLAATMTGRFGTELPANLETQLPLARVIRTGGPDDGLTVDLATVVVHWFAATDATARAFAYQGCTALRALRGATLDGVICTRVTKLAGPLQADYDNPAVRRHITTHQLRVVAV